MNEQDNNRKETTPELPLWSYQMQRDSKLAVRTRKDLELQLIARCFEDKEFYQELLTNSKAAIEKEFKTQLPENINIQVVQESETNFYMVIPCNPYQLSEEELKKLVGMTYEDVALWVYQERRSSLLDENSSIALFSRCWRDEEFKQELLENCKAVIEKEFNQKIPNDIKVQTLAETNDTLYVVLPNFTDELHFLEEFPIPQTVEVSTTVPCIITVTIFICTPTIVNQTADTCGLTTGGGGSGPN